MLAVTGVKSRTLLMDFSSNCRIAETADAVAPKDYGTDAPMRSNCSDWSHFVP